MTPNLEVVRKPETITLAETPAWEIVKLVPSGIIVTLPVSELNAALRRQGYTTIKMARGVK